MLIGRTPETLKSERLILRYPTFLVLIMINTLLGTKLNMSGRFDRFGRRIPVTIIEAAPNIVLAVGDNKVQVASGQKKKIKKTENAYVKIAGFAPRIVREIKIDEHAFTSEQSKKFSAGDKVDVSVFEAGDLVKVTGITRGKGFAGVVKRWGFAGGPKTHGQSDRHRAPGSIGKGTTPGRVFKGKKMAGHMGASKKTINNLEVLEVDSKNNLLIIKGSVPGARSTLLTITKTGKAKALPAGRQGYTPPPPQKESDDTTEKEAKEGTQAQTKHETNVESTATSENAKSKEEKKNDQD